MSKTLRILLVSLLAASPLAAQKALAADPIASEGQMLLDANGARLAPVYAVDDNGAVEIVFDGRVVTVPASTLSIVNGKLMTSLKKPDIADLP
jgi:hypothetical protein